MAFQEPKQQLEQLSCVVSLETLYFPPKRGQTPPLIGCDPVGKRCLVVAKTKRHPMNLNKVRNNMLLTLLSLPRYSK